MHTRRHANSTKNMNITSVAMIIYDDTNSYCTIYNDIHGGHNVADITNDNNNNGDHNGDYDNININNDGGDYVNINITMPNNDDKDSDDNSTNHNYDSKEKTPCYIT